jgi:hypothetical protein
MICKSVFIVALSEFSEVNSRMAQGTVFKFCFLHFALVHFVFASFAAIVIASNNWFATYHAGREITTTGTADSVILADRLFAVPSWTLDAFSRSLFRRVFGKYTDCDIDVMFPLFLWAHTFQFNKSSRALLVALYLRIVYFVIIRS